MNETDACLCPDPWCPTHATCGGCGGEVIIEDADSPAFCPACEHDVMPARACRGTPATGATASKRSGQD